MASQLNAVMVDVAALEKAFRKRKESIVEELDDDHWTTLFDFPIDDEGDDEDDEDDEDDYDREAVAAIRAQAAALIAGRPVAEDPLWEDAFFGLCVHFGERLPNEFYDRVNVDFIAEVDAAIAERVDLEPGFLQKIVFESSLPIALPAASPGVVLGFISAARIAELEEALSPHHLDLGDRDWTGAAVQLRDWVRLASAFEHGIVLWYA